MKTGSRVSPWFRVLILAVSLVLLAPVRAIQQDADKLRFRTELVSLAVIVTGQDGRPIAGLRSEDFEVYEDNIRQEIEYFSHTDQPATIGIILDISGSMRLRFEQTRETMKSFIEASHPDDQYFLMSFNDRINNAPATGNSQELLRQLNALTPQGDTSLYDAVGLALERLRQTTRPGRALLIVSDGVDNHSRSQFSEIRRQLREAHIAVYVIGSPDASDTSCGRICQMEARARLQQLADLTGGKAFFPVSTESLEQAVYQIALELRQQYSLGYTPSSTKRDGGWRKIKVRISPDHLPAKIVVRTRQGYYAMP